MAECWCNGLNYLCTQQMRPSVRLPSLKLCMSVEAMRSKCLLEPGRPLLIKQEQGLKPVISEFTWSDRKLDVLHRTRGQPCASILEEKHIFESSGLKIGL